MSNKKTNNILKKQHTILENNYDSATSAVECQSGNHHTKRNKQSVKYCEDNSSECLPCIYSSDDFDKNKIYQVSSSVDEISSVTVEKVKTVMLC